MAKKYRSEAFAAIHETMEGLHEVGAIDKQTMREFDEACLTPCRCWLLRKFGRSGSASISHSPCLHAT